MDVFDFIAGNGKRFYKGKDEVEDKEEVRPTAGQYEQKTSVDKEKVPIPGELVQNFRKHKFREEK